MLVISHVQLNHWRTDRYIDQKMVSFTTNEKFDPGLNTC